MNFEIILKPENKMPQEAVTFLNNSKSHQEAGLTKAAQKLELQAAFNVCNGLNIPIYRKGTDWNDYGKIYSGKELKQKGYGRGQKLKPDTDYKGYYSYIFTMRFYTIEQYPNIVPQFILTRLQEINKKYYPSIYIIDLTERKPSAGSIPIAQMINIDSHALVFTQPYKKSKLDPILLYKFDYGKHLIEGEYYMELARWD